MPRAGWESVLTDELRGLDFRAPGPTGRRQRIPIDQIVRGLNRVIWRALGAMPAQGHGEGQRLYAAYTSVGRRPSDEELRRRSNKAQREAEAAIRWLLADRLAGRPHRPLTIAEYVSSLFVPCGAHEAEFDLHWCGWNSERGRLRAGIRVCQNNPRGRPTPRARPVAGPWSPHAAEDE